MIEITYVCKQCSFPCSHIVYLDEREENDDDGSLDNESVCLQNKNNTAKWELVE